eukprot:3200989-Rhodomonas_salina.1
MLAEGNTNNGNTLVERRKGQAIECLEDPCSSEHDEDRNTSATSSDLTTITEDSTKEDERSSLGNSDDEEEGSNSDMDDDFEEFDPF